MLRPDTALCAFGCSTLSPSIGHRYCCGVSCRASSPFLGHWNLPLSSRLYSSTNPPFAQYSPLSRFLRRPQNRNSAFWNGSSRNRVGTIPTYPRSSAADPCIRSPGYIGLLHLKALSTNHCPDRFYVYSGPGCPPAALRIGHMLLFPLLPTLLVPRQSTSHKKYFTMFSIIHHVPHYLRYVTLNYNSRSTC